MSKLKFHLKNIVVTFLATIILIIGCIFFNYFITHKAGIVSISLGVIALLLLKGALDYWETKLKKWIKFFRD
jgi:cell division protein FtsW (lipid II flippase)